MIRFAIICVLASIARAQSCEDYSTHTLGCQALVSLPFGGQVISSIPQPCAFMVRELAGDQFVQTTRGFFMNFGTPFPEFVDVNWTDVIGSWQATALPGGSPVAVSPGVQRFADPAGIQSLMVEDLPGPLGAEISWTSVCVYVAAPPPDCPLCGDCDSNGSIDIIDSLAAARIAAGLWTPPEPACCDVDNSGTVTTLDALRLAQHATGLPVGLVCP